jgi:mercuric ion transport protein
MALSVAGIGFAGSGFIAGQRVWLTWAAAVIVAGGWILYWRRKRACASDATCATSARSMPLLLGAATSMVAASLLWQPYIEPCLLDVIMGMRE